MKIVVTISRIIVGVLFIFSGLVKAIDPLGLTYKMQEFFEAWGNSGILPSLMNWLNDFALPFSLIMITAEVVLGIMLLLGAYKRITLLSLLGLVVFFTFLTAYVLFSGKIRACGCFGDCIPLTPIQTFSKDIILLVLAVVLIVGRVHIKKIVVGKLNEVVIIVALLLTCYLQWYVLNYLPIKDCLPYKIGNNILELRKMPANAIPDKYDYVFVYQKNGEKKDFTVSSLPDSSWTFVERKEKLIAKGSNNVPPISDFHLLSNDTTVVYEKDGETAEFPTGTAPDSTWQMAETKIDKKEVTEDILNTQGQYFLLFIKDFKDSDRWLPDFYNFFTAKKDKSTFYIVTSEFDAANKIFNQGSNSVGIKILICDYTAIKTAARANPTLYEMNGPVIKNKWSWALFDSLTN